MLDQRIELNGMRRDGSELPVEITLHGDRRGPADVHGYVRDVTERAGRRSSSAARADSRDLRERDPERRPRRDDHELEQGAEHLYGYTAEEASASPSSSCPSTAAARSVRYSSASWPTSASSNTRPARAQGRRHVVDVELSVSPIKDAVGTIVGASAIVHDNSERKRAEEQRVRLLQIEQESRVRMQQAERRASFLAEAQAFLSSSLDYSHHAREPRPTVGSVRGRLVPRRHDRAGRQALARGARECRSGPGGRCMRGPEPLRHRVAIPSAAPCGHVLDRRVAAGARGARGGAHPSRPGRQAPGDPAGARPALRDDRPAEGPGQGDRRDHVPVRRVGAPVRRGGPRPGRGPGQPGGDRDGQRAPVRRAQLHRQHAAAEP